MSFTPIDVDVIKVGDPITKEILDLIKDNFDDHEDRLNASETTGGSVFIFNSAIHLANFDSTRTDVFYYKATQNFSVTDFRAQIYNKGSISSGFLTMDLQKATNTNNSNFNSILNASLSFNFATDASYLEKVASIDSSAAAVAAGEVIRIVVSGVPTGFNDKVLVVIGGE